MTTVRNTSRTHAIRIIRTVKEKNFENTDERCCGLDTKIRSRVNGGRAAGRSSRSFGKLLIDPKTRSPWCTTPVRIFSIRDDHGRVETKFEWSGFFVAAETRRKKWWQVHSVMKPTQPTVLSRYVNRVQNVRWVFSNTCTFSKDKKKKKVSTVLRICMYNGVKSKNTSRRTQSIRLCWP